MMRDWKILIIKSPTKKKEKIIRKIQNMCKLFFFTKMIRLSFMKKLLPKYFDGEWSYA